MVTIIHCMVITRHKYYNSTYVLMQHGNNYIPHDNNDAQLL